MLTPLFNLRRSKQLLWAIASAYASAIVILYLTPLALPIRAVIMLAATMSAGRAIALHALPILSIAIIAFARTAEGQWNLHTQQGQVLIGDLQGYSLAIPGFFILNFKIKNTAQIRTIIICPDRLSAQLRRQLLLYLENSSSYSCN